MARGGNPDLMMGAAEPPRCAQCGWAQVLVAGPGLGVQPAPDVEVLPPLSCATGMTDAEIEAYASVVAGRFGSNSGARRPSAKPVTFCPRLTVGVDLGKSNPWPPCAARVW
jgi:hypothetical protein